MGIYISWHFVSAVDHWILNIFSWDLIIVIFNKASNSVWTFCMWWWYMRVGRFFCGMLGGLSEEKLPRQKIISTNRFRFMSKKFYDNTVVSLYLFVLFLLYYHRQHQCQQYQHPRRHLCPSWMLRGTFSTLVTTPGWVEATNYPSEMLDASTRGRVFF